MPANPQPPFKVLFVCLGNICRSPSAEAVANYLADQQGISHLFTFDSAGTLDYHVNESPDPRAIAHGNKRGYQLAHLKGRQISDQDFYTCDDILVMDNKNLTDVTTIKPVDSTASVQRLMAFATNHPSIAEVPDPYFGGEDGFGHVLDLLEDGINGYFKAKLAALHTTA